MLDLLALPESVLQLVVNQLAAQHAAAAMRSTCRQLLILVDSCLTKLGVEPEFCLQVASAAHRFPAIQELQLSGLASWTDTTPERAERLLLPLFRAAGQHWPQLSVLWLDPLASPPSQSLLAYVAAFLPRRLTSLIIGQFEDPEANTHTAELIAASAPGLQQLQYGGGRFSSSAVAFSALATLTSLRELSFDRIGSSSRPVSLLHLSGLGASLTSLKVSSLRPGVADVPAGLAALSALRSLSISGPKAEPGLQDVLAGAVGQQLTHLRYSTMASYSPEYVTAALTALKNHPRLMSLDVSCANIDDSGLAVLSTMSCLASLHVRSLTVSATSSGVVMPHLTLISCRKRGFIDVSLHKLAPQLANWHSLAPLPSNHGCFSGHPTLAHLHCSWSADMVQAGPCLASLPQLYCWKITDCDCTQVLPLLQHLSLLRVLTFTRSHVLAVDNTTCDDSFVRALVNALPQLENLRLPGSGSFSDASMMFLASGLKNLRALKLHAVAKLTPVGVLAALSSTSLRSLHLSRCKKATEALCGPMLSMRDALGGQCLAEVVFK